MACYAVMLLLSTMTLAGICDQSVCLIRLECDSTTPILVLLASVSKMKGLVMFG